MLFKKKSPLEKKGQFRLDFFKNSLHEWILKEEGLKHSFDTLFNSFNLELYDFFSLEKKLLIIPSRGEYACAIPHSGRYHLILIYPDLVELLRSKNKRQGLAILAHEIGHIYLGHSDRKIDPLDAQFEADYFSFLLGFGDELIGFLKEIPGCKQRLDKLLCITKEEGPR